MKNINIKKFEQKNISEEAILKIESVVNTTYEDGSVWVEYTVNNHWAYELSYEYSEDDLEKIESDIRNGFLKIDKNKSISVESMINKPSLEKYSKDLQRLAESCRQSANEMWFVDEDDLEYYGYDLEKLMKEVYNSDIDEYITFYEDDDCVITVYGGILTKFIF